jgi:hypothetical protein
MPTFRYYRLNHQGRIISGDYIETADLNSAILLAREACRGDPLPGFDQIEIWQDTSLVYGDPISRQEQVTETSCDMGSEL